MQVDRGEINKSRHCFAKFPARSYSTIQEGLMQVMVEKNVGRNGWAVMVALSKSIYSDGRLGKMSSQETSRVTGLTSSQVARGMAELRDKNIIVPVFRTTSKGYRHLDRSNLGHVAQYCFTKETWARIDKVT